MSSGDPRSSTGIRQKLFTAVVDNRATSIFFDAWVVIVGIVEPLFSDDPKSSQDTAYRDILDLVERGAPLLVEIEWTSMAFARMRELDGLLLVPGTRTARAKASIDDRVELAAYRETVYDAGVAIQGFKCKDTEALFKTGKSQCFGAIRKVATRKLTMLEAATVREDLQSPPGNRLEALVSDRAGQHSIRVNDQFRICFVWTDTGPTDVEITNHYA